MFFFKGREDMGLDASLNLLDLSPNATIEDANQAYSYLHRMIEVFHRDNEADNGDRHEDLELLTCAYEKAVSYLSDPDSRHPPETTSESPRPNAGGIRPAADLHFTINFPAPEHDHAAACGTGSQVEPAGETVENAISIISRRLNEAESALEDARQAVEAATAAVDDANRRLEESKQARMTAVIAAKSAKSRALLLEIEANRAAEEAIRIAEKVRDRVDAARQAAKDAKSEAETAQDQIGLVIRLEETAAAEVVCAEDRLEKAKNRLKTLTHTVVEARSRLRVFRSYGSERETSTRPPKISDDPPDSSRTVESDRNTREQIMCDLMEIENSLNVRKRQAAPAFPETRRVRQVNDQPSERRQHARLHYPSAKRPIFSCNGRSIPVVNLSQNGMGLAPDALVGQSPLVRGAIVFNGLPSLNVTGRIVRQNGQGLGLRLVTRIGNHVLDQERMRVGA